jgi:hypothetical protein
MDHNTSKNRIPATISVIEGRGFPNNSPDISLLKNTKNNKNTIVVNKKEAYALVNMDFLSSISAGT